MYIRPLDSTLFPYTTLFRSEHIVSSGGNVTNIDADGTIHAQVTAADDWSAAVAARAIGHPGRQRLRRSQAVTILRRLDDLRSEEHTSELQSHSDLVCRLLLE